MVNFFLNDDESIVLTNQNIVVEKGQYEAILTNRRLILIRSDETKAPAREIMLCEIGSVIPGENNLGEPTITLSHYSSDGVLQALELTFSRNVGDQTRFHYQEWIVRLKEQVKIAAQEQPAPIGIPPKMEERGNNVIPVTPDIPVNQDALVSTPLSATPETPPVHKETRPFKIGPAKVIILTLIIATIIIGGVALSHFYQGTSGAGTKPVSPDATKTPSVNQIVAPTTPSVTITTIPVPPGPTINKVPEMIIPPSGIWVRVQYQGNFTGTVGIQGGLRDIAGTGDRFYQIPETGGIIDAEIQKLDNSGRELVIIIYNNGTAVKRGSTTVPAGTVSLNTMI